MQAVPQHSDPASAYRLPATTVLATIFAFWLFNATLVTVRAWVVDFPAQDEMAFRRTFVTAASMLITVGMWMLLRLFDKRPLAQRVAAAALVAIPAAVTIAYVNYYAFYIYEPDFMMDGEIIVAIAKNHEDVTVEIFETSISRYFFLIAWASLYLALGFANDVRAAERKAATFARAAQFAELRALRYQINPHFLFNSLNSLSALIMANRKAEAEDMILNLSSFYRAALAGDSTGDISLSEEIDVQRLYLDIERTRFTDRLSVDFAIDDAARNRFVPGLILQPLVENAIKHGVARTSAPVHLTISALIEPNGLHLSVEDDAPQIGSTEPVDGIGLSNVRDRLAARYGDNASLQVGRKPNGNFTATMIISDLEAAAKA